MLFVISSRSNKLFYDEICNYFYFDTYFGNVVQRFLPKKLRQCKRGNRDWAWRFNGGFYFNAVVYLPSLQKQKYKGFYL